MNTSPFGRSSNGNVQNMFFHKDRERLALHGLTMQLVLGMWYTDVSLVLVIPSLCQKAGDITGVHYLGLC